MSAEIVPAENMSSLDTLDTEAREIAITGMLDNARSWLAHAVESTAPAKDISEFKAYIATAAETAKRLRVSKAIQQDAVVMVRRTERVLGQAIRTGQGNGEIKTREGNLGRLDRDNNAIEASPDDFASRGDLSGNGAGIYHLTDDVSDDQFEDAIDRAQGEGNVSRANVVRKVEEVKSGAERQADKWQRIAVLATEGRTRHQVASIVGMSFGGLSNGARQRGITFPADALGTRRNLDASRVMSGVTSSVAAAAFSIQQVDLLGLDEEEAQEWADSLSESITTLRRAVRQIRESFHE